MRIALITNFLYPEKLGGTEIYCYELAKALIHSGNEVFWMVPNFDAHEEIRYKDASGIQVIKFAAIEEGKKADEAFVNGSFVTALLKNNINVAHFHEFGGFEGISAESISAAKRAGLTVIVTLHLVHYTCRTGTMRYAGAVACNGLFIPHRCAACYKLSGTTGIRGIDVMLTTALSKTLRSVKHTTSRKINQMLEGFKKPLKLINALQEADAVVCLTRWFKEVLLINGIPDEKIKLILQSAPVSKNELPVSKEERSGYVYIGRINREKGIALLEQAARKLKLVSPEVQIDLFGPLPTNKIYAEAFLKKLETIGNIIYKGVLQPEQVSGVISRYKAVLLPSLVAEMAPLIIMEANQLRLPVIASDVPGSRELIEQYDSGVLFEYNSAGSLVKVMQQVARDEFKFSFRQPEQNNFTEIAERYMTFYRKDILELEKL